MKEIEMHTNYLKNDDKPSEIYKLKQEIETLNIQLFEGSNIRNGLRKYLLEFQKEAHMKLNNSYKKILFMKESVKLTIKLMNKKREYVEKNNSLRHLLYTLKQKFQNIEQN